MPRLETFMAPFVESFQRQEPDQHAHTYVYGLLSDLKRKNVESIVYRFGQDRLPLQRFILCSRAFGHCRIIFLSRGIIVDQRR
jgi:hypothetical protein